MALNATDLNRRPARWVPAPGAIPTGTRAAPPVYYLVPRHWMLADVMTPVEWYRLRERVWRATAVGARCACPRRCPATVLHEQWDCDDATHTKHFLEARLLCAGCHWLNTRTWRVETRHELRHHSHRHQPKKTLSWTA